MKRQGAVASPHHAASEAGLAVLASGGNAMDAAIATNAMLAVAYPHMCGLGGDLFLLYFDARTGAVHCLNGTGPAPALATRDEYAARGLDAVPARGPLSLTVPGTVAAWGVAAERFGSRPLADLLAHAADVAESGVAIAPRLAAWMQESQPELGGDAHLARTFLDADGRALPAGALLRQPALANALRRIAQAGPRDFYEGELGAALWRAVADAGGLLRGDDLQAYAPSWTRPLRATYGELDVLTTPPNSQGIATLLMLDHLQSHHDGPPAGAEYVHALAAAKRAAFSVRDGVVTDPAHMVVDADELLTGARERERVAAPPVGGDTVYLCTADADGNACSLIQSIYYGFGSAFVAGDTGVLMHNRAHYFSLDPTHPNRLEPGKRTLHTLMACMALQDGRPRFVFGTMGADGQPQTNTQVLLQLAHGVHPQRAVAAPRVLHGRFLLEDDPDVLHVEGDMDPETLATLAADLPALNVVPACSERLGHAHAIALDADGSMWAGADPRSDGSAELLSP